MILNWRSLPNLKNLATSREPIAGIEDQKPLEEKRKVIEDQKAKLEQDLASEKKLANDIESKFRSLEVKRDNATQNFEDEKMRLLHVYKKTISSLLWRF